MLGKQNSFSLPLSSKLAFTSDQLLHAIRTAHYDLADRVPSFREFDGLRRREIIAEHENLTFNETYRYLPDEGLRHSYNTYVLGRFARGALIPDRLWTKLDWETRTSISDTTRGRIGRITPDSPSVIFCPKPTLTECGDPTTES